MHLVFLGARLRLTKTFFAQNGGPIHTTPYPHVARVTSFHEVANTLADFHAALIKHASYGRCLFGGRLTAPLNSESRAGKTMKAPREWVVFDFDCVEAADHAEVVAKYLPPECQNVSYIAQVSASMWRPDMTRWSGHIFMQLKEPVEEQRVKQWFEYINFSVPALTAQMALSDSLQALHWPLDRSAAYNSKLIYIAPPSCIGFEPVNTTPFVHVKKKGAALTIPAFTPVDSVTIRQQINHLRRTVGLDEIAYDTRTFEGTEVMINAAECVVQGIKASGDHYIRFNLNGGDSYAYFIDLRAPELIRNFKGEPYLKTEEVAPDLWAALRGKARQIVQKPPLDEGSEVLAFYTTNQGSKIRVGLYEPVHHRLTLNLSSETAARAWLAEYGMLQKGFLPHYNLVFDPQSETQVVAGSTDINQFCPSKYMVKRAIKPNPKLSDIPPTINRLLRSVLGDPTDEILSHYINWLACIMQYRCKTGTAWVAHGRTGTGKGTLVKYVLRPLLGNEYVRNIQMHQFTSQFNAWLETALLVIVEEADIKAVENNSDLQARARHYITDSPVEINQKGVPTFAAPNYANFMFNANERTVVVVTSDDRRYNIPNRQEKQLFLTPNEYKTLCDGSELDAFAELLMSWPADMAQASRIIETEARANMHEATTSINQLIAEAVLNGDLQFFIERTPTQAEAVADFQNRFNPLGLYNDLLNRYIAAAAEGKSVIVNEGDLFVLFRTLIPDERYFQDSKTWRRRHFKSLGLAVDERHRHPDDYNVRERGVIVKWKPPAFDDREEAVKPNESVVVPITKTTKSKRK